MTRRCANCCRPFEAIRWNQQYCCGGCYRSHRGISPVRLAEQDRECGHCGAAYTPAASRQRYCTADCRAAARAGQHPAASLRGANLLADWDWVLSRVHKAMRARGPYLETVPVVTLPCELALSGKHGSNGRILLVRCRCQAQCRNAPRANFWGYDPLGEAAGLAAAVRLWREHRAGMTELEESA